MKLADALHHRTRPAGRPIQLSPCSIVCPSGTIYISLWPHLCIELSGGTSVGWPLDRVRICISDDIIAGMDVSIPLLSMLPTAVQWRVVVEELFASP